MTQPHPDTEAVAIACGVVTVSDSRTAVTDRSGQLICDRLQQAGHQVITYQILPDEPEQIRAMLPQLVTAANPPSAVILNGGTGIAPRDTTYDAIASLLDKTLPGFGEIFRLLSYEQIGSRAIASRAVAGSYGRCLVFSLPGSSKAVELALDRLILPELPHLVKQLTHP